MTRPGMRRVAVTARAVAPWHGRGGLERHVADLVRHLAGCGHAVTLIVPPPAAGADPLDPPGCIRVVTVPYRTFPGAARRGTTILDRDTAYPWFGWRAGRVAAALARAGEIDIVHGLGASVLGYAFAKRRAPDLPPFVLNPQGLEEFGATDPSRAGLKPLAYWPLQRAVRACAREAGAVLATDRSLVPVVLKHLPVRAERVPVVPNAIDMDRCDALAASAEGTRLRDRYGLEESHVPDDPAEIPSRVPLLLSVGRVERNKGFHVMVDALARLSAHGIAYRWALIGDGPFLPALRRHAAATGMASHMIVPGRVDDAELHAWYEAADLFVHPTLYEGSSLVTLEAMAHRRPVIGTRAGGIPDKVVPNLTGWLVPPGDAAALAETLTQALDAHSRWARMGDEGRALATREFAWPVVVRRLISVYDSLLSQGPARAPVPINEPDRG